MHINSQKKTPCPPIMNTYDDSYNRLPSFYLFPRKKTWSIPFLLVELSLVVLFLTTTILFASPAWGNISTVTKAFAPNSINAGGTSTLTITIVNSPPGNPGNITFTDTYPAGLTNTVTPTLTNTCGGTATAIAGGNSLSLSGGSISGNSSCTVSVNVTSTTAGSYTNPIFTVTSSTNNANSNAPTLTVVAPPPLTITSTAGICATMNQVTVTFSEDVDITTAETASNYSVDNGITVTTATLTSSNTATLTTSILTDLTTYTVTVNNVENITGTPIAPGSTSSFLLDCSVCSARDDFTTASYANSDSALAWTSNWVETNDDGSPSGGDAYISGGDLILTNTSGSLPEIARELDLTGATSATLELTFSTTAGVDTNDRFRVEVSGDGGGSWFTLETIDGISGASTQNRSYNIDAYINNNTQIRFLIRQRYNGANEAVHFDYAAVLAGGLCVGPALNHYAINHDGTGIICLSEQITISAHDASHLLVDPSTATINLSTSTGRGTWSRVVAGTGTLTDATAGDGIATYAFPGGETSVTLAFNYTIPAADPEAVNINITDGTYTEDATEDSDLTFSMAGFLFVNDTAGNQTIPVQIAGKDSSVAPNNTTLGLQAVRTSDSDPTVCDTIFSNGVDVGVEIGAECLDPSTCAGQQVSIINNAATTAINTNNDNGGSGTSSYSNTTLRFGANSKAEIALNYPDVGQIQLHARYNIPLDEVVPSPSGNYLTGSSNAFVVRPFAFHVTAAGNPAATNAAGVKYTGAGNNFDATVRAVQWQAADDDDAVEGFDGIADGHADTDPNNNVVLLDNALCPNYGQETITESVFLSPEIFLPGGGNNPVLGGASTFNGFAGGSDTNTVAYNDVGIIELVADVADGDYLGAGNVTGKSGHVGRFYPDHYNATINSNGTLKGQCSGTFTYIGQPMGYSTQPTITITAENASNTTTQNYTGAFIKLIPGNFTFTAPTEDTSQDGTDGTTKMQITTSLSNGAITDNSDGTIMYTLSNSDTYTYDKDANSLIGNFTSDIRLPLASVQDSDTVSATTPAPLPTLQPTGAEIRFGRYDISSAFGPETDDLSMITNTLYFDGTDFTNNTLDTCTSLTNLPAGPPQWGDILLPTASYTDSLNEGETAPTSISFANGTGDVTLSASGIGNDGSVGIIIDLSALTGANMPWLHYDWDSDGNHDNDPSATATFGIYRGNDRIINWQEIFR